MESWGSVCVDVSVLQKDKEVERKNENEWGTVIPMKY